VETIELQCGSCGQMMSISAAHLGSQVQCPHCQAVVQTPAPAGQLGTSANPTPQFSVPEAGERESIFGHPEATDDLFDAAPPRIEMPPLDMPAEAAPPRPAPSRPVSSYEPTVTMEPASVPPSSPYDDRRDAPASPFAPTAGDDIAPIVPRNLPKRSTLAPILLIFLIPYSICTTLFVAYLLWMNTKYEHPLKMLPDPTKEGAPRVRIIHDAALPADMKVGLGQTLRIGAIEITPHEVKRIASGDLVLVFKARNVSDDQTFTPIADQWLRYSGRSMTEPKPYTFLERQRTEKQRIYGGNLEWIRAGGGKELVDGELNPGEEALVQLTTEDKYRQVVPNMVGASERLLWRIQVRRGLVPFEGKMVSATAIVGVDFTAREIVNDASEG
jgi:hypothetical protein